MSQSLQTVTGAGDGAVIYEWFCGSTASQRDYTVTASQLEVQVRLRSTDRRVLVQSRCLLFTVVREATALDVSTPVGRFVLFRLVFMMPWSARIADDDLSFYSAAVIGSLFNEYCLPNRLLRFLADTWGHRSIR